MFDFNKTPMIQFVTPKVTITVHDTTWSLNVQSHCSLDFQLELEQKSIKLAQLTTRHNVQPV